MDWMHMESYRMGDCTHMESKTFQRVGSSRMDDASMPHSRLEYEAPRLAFMNLADVIAGAGGSKLDQEVSATGAEQGRPAPGTGKNRG